MIVNQTRGAEEFFARRPVFTLTDLRAWYGSRRTLGVRSLEPLLAYHTRCGRLVRVRRGLYAVVPPGSSAATLMVDPFLLAGSMTDDAVLAYHSALEVHGKAHSVSERFLYLTARAARPLMFRGQRFVAVLVPASLRNKKAEQYGVVSVDRMGLDVRVTSLERTMVDVLDRPRLGAGWEEIWRSLESIEFFDLDAVIDYALLLGNATTIAKVGFYLEQHRTPLMVEDQHLARLRAHCPRGPRYLSRRERRPGRLVTGWNLIVPPEVLERHWQEVW